MTNKEKILIFLPIMKELEAMGLNPIKIIFGKRSFEDAENCYIAIAKTKKKYPNWYKEVSEYVNKLMLEMAA